MSDKTISGDDVLEMTRQDFSEEMYSEFLRGKKQGALKELKKLLKQINRDLKEIKYDFDIEFDSQITSFDIEIPKLIYQEKHKLLFLYKQNTIKRIKEL